MNSMLDRIKQSTGEFMKLITGLKDIDKDELDKLISLSIENHKIFINAYNKISAKDLKALNERLFNILPSMNDKSSSTWVKYQKSLQNRARVIETEQVFSSVVKAQEVMKNVLSEVKSNLDTLFGKEDMISPATFRKSHIAVFGAIIASIKLSKWSEFMFTYLLALIDGTDADIPKYRELYIYDNVDDVISLVNIYVNNEKYSLVKEIGVIQSKADDQALIVNNISNVRAIDPVTLMAGIATAVKFITIAIVSFSILRALFRWLPEHHSLMTHEVYLRNKELKEWLETHVAKLRMDLSDMNPNDPKYQKLMKTIEVYDEKIRDLDRKIDEYLNS